MNINIPAPEPKQTLTLYTVLYVNDGFVVKVKGTMIPVNKEQITIKKKTKTLYSLPCNDKQVPWSKRKFTATPNTDLVVISKQWSTIYHNQKVRGYVKSGQFFIL